MRGLTVAALAILCMTLVVGCGAARPGPLRLNTGGGGQIVTSKSTDSGPGTWSIYVSLPVGRRLTIGPVGVLNQGRHALVLLSMRQLHPAAGLDYGEASFSDNARLTHDAEGVALGSPRAAISHAFDQRFPLSAFAPLDRAAVAPTPRAGPNYASGSALFSVTADRRGRFHIGDWVVTYRVGSTHYRVTYYDDGYFCAGLRHCRAPATG